jgi:hypothetical protein
MGSMAEKWEVTEELVRFTRGALLLPATDPSVASFSSHIRMPFHKAGIFDSGGPGRRCVAR